MTGVAGKLDAVLTTPDGGVDLGNPVPNDYFKAKGNFVPTDVEQLDGKLYITAGYSKLDYVRTARSAITAWCRRVMLTYWRFPSAASPFFGVPIRLEACLAARRHSLNALIEGLLPRKPASRSQCRGRIAVRRKAGAMRV
jgi:hypothetical protein